MKYQGLIKVVLVTIGTQWQSGIVLKSKRLVYESRPYS